MIPETKYAKSGDVHIAYQVVGTGPIDLVLIPGLFTHVEHQWEEPSFARFLGRLASFSDTSARAVDEAIAPTCDVLSHSTRGRPQWIHKR